MKLYRGEKRTSPLRTVLATMALGAGVYAPLALAIDVAPSASFSSLAEQRPALLLGSIPQPESRLLEEIGARAGERGDIFAVASAPAKSAGDDEVLAAALPRLDTSTAHYDLGGGWRALHGGGWLSEREFCGDCRTSPSAVPEVSTKVLTVMGLIAVVWFVRRSRQRMPAAA